MFFCYPLAKANGNDEANGNEAVMALKRQVSLNKIEFRLYKLFLIVLHPYFNLIFLL